MRMRKLVRKLKRPLAWIVPGIQDHRLYARLAKTVRGEIEIVAASVSDWEEVHAILNPDAVDLPPPQGADCVNYVARRKGKVIGWVQLVHAEVGSGLPAGYWLFGLGVRTRYRRMGVGEMLSLRIVRAARERGAEGLGLMLFEDNLPAVRLYQKLGFQKHDFPGLKERFEEEERAGGRRHMSMMVSFQDPNRRESP